MNFYKQYAYKSNGFFHRFWQEALLLAETKDYLITATPKSTRVVESTNYIWNTQELAINYFSKNHWFNIIIMFKKEELIYYCNMASPCLFELNSIKYIDYDIDLKYYSKSKRIIVLDLEEFKINKIKYNYNPIIIKKLEDELIILKEWVKYEIGPFSKDFILKYYHIYLKMNGDNNESKNSSLIN